MQHAQNKRRVLAFPQRVRQHAVATLLGLHERRGRVVCTLKRRLVNSAFGVGICNAF